ncbi:MAG: peptidoglycan-binding protein [Clostridia bacterium]|nr:peptidoglycan-binding protein [Clostridia bacterium]
MSKVSKLLYTALSQVGVTENGRNNVPYNTWYYGREVCDSAGTGAYAWCVVFLSWCAHQAGLSAAIPKENNVGDLMNHYKKLGRFYERDARVPETGDIIFFRTASGTGRHVGLVLATNGSRVATVEGNTSDAVRLRNYSLSDSTITGWGIPNYAACSMDSVEASRKEELALIELKQGDRGEAVRALQIRLLYEGYDLGNFGNKKDGADGQYGGKTRAAVLDYQKKQGLDADGIAGVKTLSRLYGLN